MTSINDLEKEIFLIKNRNKKVEIDKAWETSFRWVSSIYPYSTLF
ncbi:MAG: hypothetical protein UR54_C0030G0008 [Candidatus Roizmanbacteria bacterium GW2011_GWA2_34_18]|uniref:Uncharacterized protein n=1 Tax=Candidatus Roizmanbacteria bacterium GW2011_GWA2_34_18 TaxID=1618477 RepID=A0A0G0D7L8_9BACT|nr:MAG: hypothetical protein UR54_C0030G0008 [Candidatus Roizmanbacteria bacterium GW2011_GWA2_34_18]